jgi:SAM-dependent methyltransferase
VAGVRPTGWKSYDSVADDYDRLTPPLFGAIARDLVEFLGPSAGVTVLDAGTGTGVTAEAIAKVVGPRGLVVGVDPSLAMLHLARRRAPHVVAGVAPGLPFPDDAFDVVAANLVLSHFRDTGEGAAELVRVLGAGGRLGVTAWPEDRDEPESDGTEAGTIVEKALDDAGLPLETPSKAAAGEESLRDAGNLRTVLEGAGVKDVVFEERTYPRLLDPSDYLGWRLWGSLGRYLRSITDDATWDGFRHAALDALELRFPDGVRIVSTARLAVGIKPA